MAIYNELEPFFRKPMVVFFVVDPTLARYWENQAESFQNTLNRTVPVLRMTFQNSVDSSCGVAVLVTGEEPAWQTPDGPVPWQRKSWTVLVLTTAIMKPGRMKIIVFDSIKAW